MGGKLTCHLNSKEKKYISETMTEVLDDLIPLYKHHYSSHLMAHLRKSGTEPTRLRPLRTPTEIMTHGQIIMEGSLPQCVDEIWSHRHLQVTNTYAVEIREAKEVFKGGWGRKTELPISGCQILTSIPEHCKLVDGMCRHITGVSDDKLPCWGCPTVFPVLIQPPYSSPVCLATSSLREQTQWSNILRAASLHQSSVLWCENSPESRTFLEAVSSLKKLRSKNRTEVLPVGNEEEVLVGMVMEEMMSFLKEAIFPRISAHHKRKKKLWFKMLSEVSNTVRHQIRADMEHLREKLSVYHSDIKKQITTGLQQSYLLHDHITDMITEEICESMLQSLLQNIIPKLNCTLQEVTKPIHEGFACIWRFFLNACDDIINTTSTSTSANDIKREVMKLRSGPDNVQLWECLDRLHLSSESRVWLQDTWEVPEETWRPLVLMAQNELNKVVNMCASMFWRLVSRYPCFTSDSSQLTAVLCRVKHSVVKTLESELLARSNQLIQEMMLRITLPAFEQGVDKHVLSRYNAMIIPEQAVFIPPDVIFNSILRNNLSAYIQSEMRYFLPPGFDLSNTPCRSEPVHHKLQPQGDFQQDLLSESKIIQSDSVSNTEGVFKAPKNLEEHILSDAGEYIHLREAGTEHFRNFSRL